MTTSPRGPVDWARQQAAERQTQAADPAWTTLRARATRAEAAIARVRRLIEQHSVAVGTHLLEEALDDQPTPAHNAGPSIRECADQDAAHWNTKYAGEGQ